MVCVKFLSFFVLFLMPGCCFYVPLSEEVLDYYQLGNSREEIEKEIGYAPMLRLQRPERGWSIDDKVNRGAERVALYYEKANDAKVSYVDVYWINTRANKVFVKEGTFWDHLFFDGNKELINYRRKAFD